MGPQNLPFPAHMVNALVRRGVNPMVLMQQSPMQTQVSPESPNFDPSMQQPSAPPMPDRPARMGSMMPPPTQQPPAVVPPPSVPPQAGPAAQAFMNSVAPAPGAQPANPAAAAMVGQPTADPAAGVNPLQSEAESIVSTLSDRLKHHSKQASKFLQAIIDSTAPPETAAQPATPTP